MLLLTIVASGIHFVETNLQVLFIGEPEDCCNTWVRCKTLCETKIVIPDFFFFFFGPHKENSYAFGEGCV